MQIIRGYEVQGMIAMWTYLCPSTKAKDENIPVVQKHPSLPLVCVTHQNSSVPLMLSFTVLKDCSHLSF